MKISNYQNFKGMRKSGVTLHWGNKKWRNNHWETIRIPNIPLLIAFIQIQRHLEKQGRSRKSKATSLRGYDLR